MWELELSAHLLKRMEDRAFNEVDLRGMLEHAGGHRADILEGRFVIEVRQPASLGKSSWSQTTCVNCWW